jgi:hypothetical protein
VLTIINTFSPRYLQIVGQRSYLCIDYGNLLDHPPRLSILPNPFLSSNVLFTPLHLTPSPVRSTQLRQGPARRNRRCHQEDHEALLDPRVEQEDLPRVEVVEAFEARERESFRRFWAGVDVFKHVGGGGLRLWLGEPGWSTHRICRRERIFASVCA